MQQVSAYFCSIGVKNMLKMNKKQVMQQISAEKSSIVCKYSFFQFN